MITVTKRAAKQIKASMMQTDSEGLSLRIAARRLDDGTLDYAMGLDGLDHNDSHNRSNGIDIVVAPTSTELLSGATLDYVELEGSEARFIFINPNDPDHVPPTDLEDDQGSA